MNVIEEFFILTVISFDRLRERGGNQQVLEFVLFDGDM